MTTDRAGYIAHRLVLNIPAMLLALFGDAPMPAPPRSLAALLPRPRSQAKRRKLARRRRAQGRR
jgi:hypothetical protein